MTKKLTAMTMILVLLTIGSTSGGEFPVGHINSDGYSYAGDGVWTLNGSSYTRSLYQSQSAGYWSCGLYYPGAMKYYWNYAAYTAPEKPTAVYVPPKLPSYTDAAWKTKILEVAERMDRDTHDHYLYLQSIQALGLGRSFPGYGPMQSYGGHQQGAGYGGQRAMPYEYSLTNYGATAGTQYGYSYNATARDLYGDNNLGALFQQAGQLTAQALRLGGESNTNFQSLVGQEGGNRARVAEILARGQMAHQVLQALQAPGESKGFQFRFKSGGQVERISEPNVDPEVTRTNGAAFASVFASKCAACHTGKDAKGKFTAEAYLAAPLDIKQRVWGLLTTDDDKVRMPRNPDGTPGKRLSPEEFRAFIFN